MIEKLFNGLTTTAIGLTTVFTVLVLLWGMVELMRVALSALDKEEKKAPEVVNVSENKNTIKNDNSEIVAAISAAIAVYLDVPQSSFKIKSFKRVGSNFKR